MKLQYIVLVWSAFVTGTLATLMDRNARMVCGGSHAKITAVPELVSLRYKGKHICGGAMISKNWVLTAAHCFVGSRQYRIRAGTSYRNGGGSIHEITQIVIHPYHMDRHGQSPDNNDIALVRVHPPFQVDVTRKPIRLPNLGEPVENGISATVSGWGLLGDGSVPKHINRVNVDILSRPNCARYYPNIMKGQICATHANGGAGACRGDSGGPLTAFGRLWGIVSWGCTVGSIIPGIYTDVLSYRDWIRSTSGI